MVDLLSVNPRATAQKLPDKKMFFCGLFSTIFARLKRKKAGLFNRPALRAEH
jgi:hypothetical protein